MAAIRAGDEERLARSPSLATARWEPYSALGWSVSQGNRKAVQMLARRIGRERMDAPDAVVNGPIRYTALAYAVARGDEEMARLLLDEGARRDAPYTRDNGRTWIKVGMEEHQ